MGSRPQENTSADGVEALKDYVRFFCSGFFILFFFPAGLGVMRHEKVP